jgi:hypothetical protein
VLASSSTGSSASLPRAGRARSHPRDAGRRVHGPGQVPGGERRQRPGHDEHSACLALCGIQGSARSSYGGGWYGHWMRITRRTRSTTSLLGWLHESYQQMGLQERLAGR